MENHVMAEIPGGASESKGTFIKHVFNSNPESNAEFFNVVQYSVLGLIPILILNKLIHNYIPDVDEDKSSLELLVEILIQLIIMFCGIVLVHRVITYIPTYSGYLYESMNLTSIVLAFLIIILSLQTKIGLKVNILYDRIMEMWNGPDNNEKKEGVKNNSMLGQHRNSQADYLEENPAIGVFPPQPIVTNKPSGGGYDHMMGGTTGNASESLMDSGPMAANSVIGGSFGSSF
tara:strand:- start:21236 stop:21931 length:696 start_codon:yes stop_codon:yes gene_type:complete